MAGATAPRVAAYQSALVASCVHTILGDTKEGVGR